MRTMLGECLRQAGIIAETDLQAALVEHKRSGDRLGAVLIRMNMATERQVARALASQLGFSFVHVAEHPPDPAAVVLIPKEVALKRHCIAVAVEKNMLTVAMSDPLLFPLVQDLEFQTGHRITQVVATRGDIVEAIHRWYPERAPDEALVRVTEPLARPGEDVFEQPAAATGATPGTAPIIDIVDLVIASALKSRASDVHIEPTEGGVVVRQRLDGLLKEVMDLPKWVHEGVVARIKVMAGLDIAERRLPQDGRIRATAEGRQDIDLRVSTLRTIFGEKIVLRVLDHRKGVPPLEDLGFSAAALDEFRFLLRHQHGMILVAGPTGSGKTTTLCSALAAVRSERTNIVTIEDPVEYQIPGINQTQINARIDLTFASSLRSILRQDPDVVMVGEIRDQETARIAMQAAQTGHLVLSTLHTDDAPSCVTRLTDIGIEPYVSASALVGVIAQRLVRRLCDHCRRPYTPESDTLRAMRVTETEAETLTFYREVGCDQCNQTGYRGRVGIYEIMLVTDTLRRQIAQKADEATLRDAALTAGMISLGEDGLAKVKAGVTTPKELLRVVTEVRETRASCPACGVHVSRDFVACPGCGRRVGRGCPHCGRAMQPGWTFCPYCAKGAAAGGAAAAGTAAGAAPPRQGSRHMALQRGTSEGPAADNVAEFKK